MGFVYYINRGWCVDASVVITHCSPLTDCFLTWNSAGFFLSREFSVIMVMPAYILPGANANETLHELHNAISDQKKRPTPRVFFFFFIVPGAFNHTKLKTSRNKVLPTTLFPTLPEGAGICLTYFTPTSVTHTKPSLSPTWVIPTTFVFFSSQHTDHCSNYSGQ